MEIEVGHKIYAILTKEQQEYIHNLLDLNELDLYYEYISPILAKLAKMPEDSDLLRGLVKTLTDWIIIDRIFNGPPK